MSITNQIGPASPLSNNPVQRGVDLTPLPAMSERPTPRTFTEELRLNAYADRERVEALLNAAATKIEDLERKLAESAQQREEMGRQAHTSSCKAMEYRRQLAERDAQKLALMNHVAELLNERDAAIHAKLEAMAQLAEARIRSEFWLVGSKLEGSQP